MQPMLVLVPAQSNRIEQSCPRYIHPLLKDQIPFCAVMIEAWGVFCSLFLLSATPYVPSKYVWVIIIHTIYSHF